ncbi:MAG: hypothetical protein GY856_05140 [bacterium]|nr:hypothetical protein [bacterium]
MRPHQLYIQQKRKIDQGKWRAAVEATPDVRIIEADRVRGEEAGTGIRVSVVTTGETAEVNFGAMGWTPTFFWKEGKIRFNAPSDPDDEQDPTHRAAAALARQLRATIVDEDGETYDW